MVDGKTPFPVLTRGPLGVIYGVSHSSSDDVKEQVFTLLIHGDYTRTYLQSQDEVRESIIAELNRLWPGFGTHVRAAYFLSYHPAATPGWPVGRSSLDDLAWSLREANAGLYLAGDYVYSSHADGAVRSAQEVAKRLARDLGK